MESSLETPELPEVVEPDWPSIFQGSPLQIFKKWVNEISPSIESTDRVKVYSKAHQMASKSYWAILLSASQHRYTPERGLQFSFIDQIHFDFSVWCGEQFSEDPEVIDFLRDESQDESVGVDKSHPQGLSKQYKIVLDECIESLQSWRCNAPIHTITQWLSLRERQDRLHSETEAFVIPSAIIRQMPNSAGLYLSLRDKRKKIMQSLKPFLLRCPGINDKLLLLACNGNLLDQIDFFKVTYGLSGSEKKKFDQVLQIWQDVTGRLKTHFKHEKILSSLDQIEKLSQHLQNIIIKDKIDVRQVLKKAKELYHDDSSSKKRIARDIQVLKNNLNIGSFKSTGKQHQVTPQNWPSPIDPEDLEFLRLKILKVDRRASHRTLILLAPGSFKGFFEFDHSCLVIPMYSDHAEKSLCEAMADRLIILETLKSSSDLLEALKSLAGSQNLKRYWAELYYKWISHSLREPSEVFSSEELAFLLKYVAPPVEQYFMRDEETRLEKREIIELVNQYKQRKLDPDQYIVLAGALYRQQMFTEASKRLKDYMMLRPERREMAIALAHTHGKSKLLEAQKEILNKLDCENNLGYYQLFI